MKDCHMCGGSGIGNCFHQGVDVDCDWCNGTGFVSSDSLSTSSCDEKDELEEKTEDQILSVMKKTQWDPNVCQAGMLRLLKEV